MARLHAAKCPTCGAGLNVDPGALRVVCRYCQNVITIEKRTPPPTAAPIGVPGGVPSTTLYLDPKAIQRASSTFTAVIVAATLIPALIPVFIFLVGPAVRHVKSSVRPFPAACEGNEKLELSGDFDGPGPAITSVGVNCKITISKSKIKASSLVDESAANFELTITDSTIETTGPLVKAGTNTKLRVKGGALKSGGPVVVTSGYNLEVRLEDTALESSSDVAIQSPSLLLESKNATVRGKKSALDVENNAKVHAEATTFEATGPAFVFESNPKVDMTGGSVISKTGRAIEGEVNVELTMSGTKVRGATDAVRAKTNFRLKASDKASFVAGSGDAFALGVNANLSFDDATVDATRAAIAGDSNMVLKLASGARLTGKKGGVSAASLELESNGATIEGGAGAGIDVRGSSKIDLRQGAVTGNPALTFSRKPTTFELEGTRIVGAKVIPDR